MKLQRKAFSVLKRTLLSEREVQTTFKAIENLIVQCMADKNLLQLTKRSRTFS